MRIIMIPTMVVVGISLGLGLLASQPRRTSADYIEPSMMDLVKAVIGNEEIPDPPTDARHLIGETKALEAALLKYNLNAPAHRTDGWTNFTEAEWPFMAMAYTGFALTRLPELVPEKREWCKKKVGWILSSIRRPAMSGFMEDHFGPPFPEKGRMEKVSVFLHGHYLYLSLLAKKHLNLNEGESWHHRIQESLIRNYRREPILPSYTTMTYSSDNGSALAALALYDEIYGKQDSIRARENFAKECRKFYLDSSSKILCTYLDPKTKTRHGGPRGTAVTYLGLFLPQIEDTFAKQQWKVAKEHLILPLNEVAGTFDALPDWANPLNLMELPKLPICLEHPKTNSLNERLWGDLDSGPVVLGVGTSASGFLIGAAAMNGDQTTAEGTMKLAHHMASYRWRGDKYIATNTFHEVGQAVVFYGKVLTLIHGKKHKSNEPVVTNNIPKNRHR